MSARSSLSRPVESSLFEYAGVSGDGFAEIGVCGLVPNVEMDKSLPSRMTFPHPKPEPGSRVTPDLLAACPSVLLDPDFFSALAIVSAEA